MKEIISELAYFAARAPEVVPHWFRDSLKQHSSDQVWRSMDSHLKTVALSAARKSEEEKLLPHQRQLLEDYDLACESDVKFNEKIDTIRDEELFYMWRVSYANRMVAELSKTPNPGE